MDLIERQKAIDALAKQMPHSYTPDGSHPADKEIFMAQEIYADCIKTLEILPSAEPERENGIMDDLINRAEAQTELQFAARRYTVASEAHGEGKVLWSENLISVTDAMNALRKVQSAEPNLQLTCNQLATDLISRQAAIDAVTSLCDDCDSDYCGSCRVSYPGEKNCKKVFEDLPSAQPGAGQSFKRLTNKEWIDFLSEQFNVSRTSAREMLHGMMQWKKEDNFKKTFNSRKEEK